MLTLDSAGATLTVGEILVEIVAMSRGHGFVETQELRGPFASGAPAIFIDQVATLGGSAAMVGCVGNDDFGKLNVERLREDGVDVSAIAIDGDFPTGSAFVRYRPDGERDFVFNIAQSAAARLSLTERVESVIGRAAHLHIMGSALSMQSAWSVTSEALSKVKAKGGSISFDPNLRKELLAGGIKEDKRFSQILHQTDLLLPSGEELVTLAERLDEQDAVVTLFGFGISEIVLKRGANGATFFGSDGTVLHEAGFAVSEVDPTGAGDCFGATFLTCRRLGKSPAQSLLYANAAGAYAVTRMGPMEGSIGFAELDKFIASHGRRAV